MIISPDTSFPFACTLPVARARSWQGRGSSPTSCGRARSTSIAGWGVFTCWKWPSDPLRALLWPRFPNPAHALGVRLPHGSAWEHVRASPMDDSQFRFDPCRGHAARLHAPDAIRLRLVLPAKLHHRVLVVLGSESARRGMAGALPTTSGALGVLIRSPRSSIAVVSNLQPFTRATNFCKVLVFLEGAGISRSSLRFRF